MAATGEKPPHLAGEDSQSPDEKSVNSGHSKNVPQTEHQRGTDVATSMGVKRMEAVARAGEKRPILMWIIRICLLVCTCGYILRKSIVQAAAPCGGIDPFRFQRDPPHTIMSPWQHQGQTSPLKIGLLADRHYTVLSATALALLPLALLQASFRPFVVSVRLEFLQYLCCH